MHRSAWLLALGLLVACGDDVTTVEAPPGEGGGGGQGGGASGPLSVEANAPSETTVRVQFSRTPPAAADDAASYQLGGESGPLAVTAVSLDGTTALLTTDEQKLGVHYDLALVGEGLEALTASFPSADTARFWTIDLNSPSFPEYEVVADRKAIGSHAVIYLQQGEIAPGYQAALSFFDDAIYPIETALFTEPGDIDQNGKIVLLGLDGKGAYGGYFSPMNAMTNDETMSLWGRHSNEMEMLYINVEWGSWYPEQVIAHEFQHLLYNERHGWQSSWDYHNEGLAECAVNAVTGHNDYALSYYVADPSGEIASGISLVHWQYANYDNYALAYVFWSYVAGQLGGASIYGELFDQSGSPAAIQDFLETKLGLSFAETQLHALAATHLQAASGPFGFEGLLSFPGGAPLAASAPSQLAPFAGTLVSVGGSSIDYSGDQGDNVVFAGIGTSGVDFEAPFDVSGGVLVVLNQRFDLVDPSPEPTGLPLPSVKSEARGVASRARFHPPPFDPRLERMRRWQREALGR
jgi:hypothetical protein